jgi:ABC-type oligopeptide transport system ATPase subunit
MLEAVNLQKSFDIGSKNKKFIALDSVSLSIGLGEWVGVVGESGSGKTTLAKVLMHMISYDSGEIRFNSKLIKNLSPKELKSYYRHIQMIFQSPLSSFSPKRKIASYVIEPLKNYRLCKKDDFFETAKKLLQDVGLDEDKLYRYPHELSGGELQRVVIARAIGMKPSLIIFDEATSALDVKTQAQIVELLLELKQKNNFSAIFISHNIALAHKVASKIYVMRDAKVVEEYQSNELMSPTRDLYTKMLIESAHLSR